MFGLPPKLDLDVQALEKQFYRYSRKLHPDVHARATQQEQEWSLAQASLLNDAYRTLKNPLDRTKVPSQARRGAVRRGPRHESVEGSC